MLHSAQLFITCILDSLYPEIGQSVVQVLQRVGVKVEFPADQTCCGQPAYNAGLRKEALPLAQHTIKVFEQTRGAVVIPSGSCAAMLRHGYLELFADQPGWLERAQTLASRTYEFSEYLVDVLGISDVGARFPARIAYHGSCHLLRDLGVNSQPRALLANVRDAQLVELPGWDECCGFGGVFSAEHPEISSAMLERKCANIERSGAEVIVSCDAGCLTHINGGLQRQGKKPRVMHLAQVLART
jgi:L-lactate dehydrogenase complex protein LldE